MALLTLLDLAIWSELRPLLVLQTYDREGGHAHPRRRVEVRNPDCALLRARLLGLLVPCASCGRWMHPVRQRDVPGATVHTFYLTVSCETEAQLGCCRSGAAHDAYERIVSEVMGLPRLQDQPLLF